MLGNKACPNQLIDSSNDDYDYSRYRKYLIFRLKNLKFLDCYEVTKQEREQVSNEETFFNVVKLDNSENISSSPSKNSNSETSLKQNLIG